VLEKAMTALAPLAHKFHDPIETARAWLDEFGAATLATVVSTWGSSPVPVGGQLVVAPDGRFEGSVSGGCVEAEVIVEAADVLASDRPKLLEFGIADEMAWRAGLPCGGAIGIYLEPLQATRDGGYLDAILAARESRTALGVLTTLATGERRLFEPSTTKAAEIAASLDAGQSCLLESGQAFLHALSPSVRLVIVGATHIGQVLADLARRIGYDVVIVDPRTAFASEQRFGEIPALTDWPEASLNALKLDTRSAVVAMSHTAALDDEALAAALRSDCLYIGALGSRKTQAKRLDRLRAAGFGETELARVRGPVGLPIGAKGPAEIAISILAELVQVVRGKE
jgi:xanthine dehydrogenase accessory factor